VGKRLVGYAAGDMSFPDTLLALEISQQFQVELQAIGFSEDN
jgi:hypothetical protein